MTGRSPFIVGIGGTLRPGSTSERALRLVLARAEQMGARTRIFAGSALKMPAYDPAEAARTPEAAAMVETLRAADGVVIATPSYHGSITGLIKNALDYTEDLRSDRRVYLAGRAVGSIVCADGVQAMGATLATLRAIVHALRGWPTPFSAVINSALRPISLEGECTDPQVAQQLAFVAEQVVEFARMRRHHEDRQAEHELGGVGPPKRSSDGARLIELTLEFMN